MARTEPRSSAVWYHSSAPAAVLARQELVVSGELRDAWVRQTHLLQQTGNRQEALDRALQDLNASLEEELADALAYLLKIANHAGIDLENAYLKKMGRNWNRTWR